ncbi:uncharacterized protein K460DRAFT_188745 [Cucurbitaria berberidis CBS 394.84]|uniref:Uncharacterized protein n=1 Tax=Cucurbitaria berberidis CBS 394.84 TaxID=1168544 RepID=A0A9P4GC97_9PLEO|nr:uncharacterized protein K460DRAFT_188745 [Cucurbitaria berberidis CBS 394.84]KAF1842589.1 hypothetical protein K460DRAFT_188745 [Cucurbitaria berberidis CBS 394.84]
MIDFPSPVLGPLFSFCFHRYCLEFWVVHGCRHVQRNCGLQAFSFLSLQCHRALYDFISHPALHLKNGRRAHLHALVNGLFSGAVYRSRCAGLLDASITNGLSQAMSAPSSSRQRYATLTILERLRVTFHITTSYFSIIAFRCSRVVINGIGSMTGVAFFSFLLGAAENTSFFFLSWFQYHTWHCFGQRGGNNCLVYYCEK